MATPKTGKPVGAPSKYDPAFCEKVIELGKSGLSLEQMALQLLVSYRTLVNWRDEHPEFFHALETAHRYSQAWWENKAQEHIVEAKDDAKINAGLWAKVMAARFPDSYSDRNRLELTGKDGGAVEVDHFNEALSDVLALMEKKFA
jgi:hypothetical protein